MDRVLLEVRDHIGFVTLNRPDKLNAIDTEMCNAIIETARKVDADPSIRVVVIHGTGRAFCAGIDLSNFSLDGSSEMMNTPLTDRTHGVANKWQKVAWAWRELQVPVIAAVHGISYGGGLQIMLGADIKYIHHETGLSVMEGKWGLIPDMAGTVLMRNTIRDDIFRELTYTQRVFSGEEAVAYGFATHLSENPLEDAQTLAAVIAKRSPSATVASKKLLNKVGFVSAEDGLMLESIEQEKIIKKHNQMEAIFSSMQKREGDFKDYRDSPE